MLTLHGRGTSDNVQKVLWALGETGQPFEHLPLGGSCGGLDDPCFAAMNPHRRVPTLKDGETVVWESDAIIRFAECLRATYAALTATVRPWREEHHRIGR